MSWRDRAKPIIARVLVETAGKPDAEIRTALHDAYPFGLREYHPYKIWLDEIKRQRGTKASHAPCACTHAKGAHRAKGGACHAADCPCRGYTTETNQGSLAP